MIICVDDKFKSFFAYWTKPKFNDYFFYWSNHSNAPIYDVIR